VTREQPGGVAQPEAPERAEVGPHVAVGRGDREAPRRDGEVATGGSGIDKKGEVIRGVAGCREDPRSGDSVAVSKASVGRDIRRRAEAVLVAGRGIDCRVSRCDDAGERTGVVGMRVGEGDVTDVDIVEGVEERLSLGARVEEERGTVGRVVEISVDALGWDALAREGDPSHYRRSE
jgi:hypothetical protein